LTWQHVRFREDDRVADAPLQEFAERAQHVVLLARRIHVRAFGRDHEWHRVHAESGDAELDPEAHDLEDLGLHRRVRRVEVGLEIIEAVEVPKLGHRIARPGRLLHAGENHALVGTGGPLLRPDVPVAVFGFRIAARLLKPFVLVRGVVHHEVDDDADAALARRVGELDEIAERAVGGIDAVIVGDVVTVVFARRALERHQPDCRDPEPVQIIEPPHQPLEIADAVGVGIHVGADREAIDDRVLVPEVFDHKRAGKGRAPRRGPGPLRQVRGGELVPGGRVWSARVMAGLVPAIPLRDRGTHRNS